ncbi:MAG: RNA polymerase sigma factor [Myxococcota bacterium]
MDSADARAVDGLRRGDPAAFDDVFDRHHRRVWAFLVRLTGRTEVADELLQETFVRLARHGRRLRPDTRLRAWLFTVARNLWRSHQRWAWLDGRRLAELASRALHAEPTPRRRDGLRGRPHRRARHPGPARRQPRGGGAGAGGAPRAPGGRPGARPVARSRAPAPLPGAPRHRRRPRRRSRTVTRDPTRDPTHDDADPVLPSDLGLADPPLDPARAEAIRARARQAFLRPPPPPGLRLEVALAATFSVLMLVWATSAVVVVAP